MTHCVLDNFTLNQSLQREFTNSSKNTFLWSWAQHVLFITQKPRGERAHRNEGEQHTAQTSLEGNLYPPHSHVPPHGHMEMISEKFSTQQQRADLLHLANTLLHRICCINQTATDCTFQTPPAVNILKLAGNFILCFNFCSAILKIFVFLFKSAWSESLISTETRPNSSP